MFLLLALITAVVGVIPFFMAKKFGSAGIAAVVIFLISLWVYYAGTPSLVWPGWGWVGGLIVISWLICAAIDAGTEDTFTPSLWMPIAGVFVYILSSMVGCGALRWEDYRSMIGTVEKREWAKDIQPKDPRHVRLVPKELAFYLATKQFGEVAGAIGSQFSIESDEMTLQLIDGELWYVAPFEFTGYSAWTRADVSPGYVMVHGEDPKRQVIVKTGEKFKYMPSAFFGDNLERHLWHKYYDKGLTDYSFEIDEQGKAYWVVTMFEPTIIWGGEKVLGVIVIDPTNGEDTFYPLGKVPSWIDRVIPKSFVENYLTWFGEYTDGWVNSWWGKTNIFEPDHASIIYGADGDPYWVTDITSTNKNDLSMIGVVYTNSRTGKTIQYHAIGGTDEAVLQLVDNKVSYRKLHGAGPVLYNIYGTMTSIVPLLGESHTFMGVAFVDVANMQLAVGDDQISAYREYQKLITTAGQQLAPEKMENVQEISVVIDRFATEVRASETVYYLHNLKYPHVFTASGDISPKLPLSKVGDKVTLKFLNSEEDVVPLVGFDNSEITLMASKNQREVRSKVEERAVKVMEEQGTRDARAKIQNMSDQELRDLLSKAKKQ
ncbi:hypothetical protein D4R49_00640 [bacterium]|nr:MAG: hypothetical protein D4R49_00640 [bacterium]